MSIISVQHLVKRYEFFRKRPGLWGTLQSLVFRKKEYADAVQDISFEVAEGEIVGFLGPNGAGKTTTLKMLSGILYPTSGEVRVMGFCPQERLAAFKGRFGIVMGQKEQLAPLLPAMDGLRMLKALYGVPDEAFQQAIDELVPLLGIQDIMDIQVRKLSLGQRMKCELVAALFHRPRVLFLDEPTIGLDVVAKKHIRDFIRKHNHEQKTTIILTSHDMDDIRELRERVIIINFGKIMYDGKLSTLIAMYATEKVVTVSFTEQVPLSALESFGAVEQFQGIRASIRIPRAQVKEVAARLIASPLPIDDIAIDEMPVDDIIRAMFEAKERT